MLKTVVVFLVGALIGGLVVWKLPALGQATSKNETKTDTPKVDLSALNNDVARLKSIVPSNSHIMEDVSFHFSSLWFAGQKKNWPLAMFYYNESRNHIRWLLQKNPTTKTPEGEVVNLHFSTVSTRAPCQCLKNRLRTKISVSLPRHTS